MPTTPCPDCGNPVSDTAISCPSCGWRRPGPARGTLDPRGWTTPTVLVVVGAVLMLSSVLVAAVYPVEAGGMTCGTALVSDYREIETARAMAGAAATVNDSTELNRELRDRGKGLIRAAEVLEDACDENRANMRIKTALGAALGLCIVLSAVLVRERATNASNEAQA